MTLTSDFARLNLEPSTSSPSAFSETRSLDPSSNSPDSTHSCSDPRSLSPVLLPFDPLNPIEGLKVIPSMYHPSDYEEDLYLDVTLDTNIPPKILQLCWEAMPVKDSDTLCRLRQALSKLVSSTITTDYGWTIQTYYTLLDLYDGLWAQTLVLYTQGITKPLHLENELDPWWPEFVALSIDLTNAFDRLDKSSIPYGVEPISYMIMSRVGTYPKDHPFRLIQPYLCPQDQLDEEVYDSSEETTMDAML